MVRGYAFLAGAALALHLLWILWVIFGALLTRGRRRLAWLHIASLIYGVVIETGPWPCPLTELEQFLEQKAGLTPYREPFLVHYLDRLVYPEVPEALLAWSAAAVCAVNLCIYARRFRRRRAARTA